MKKNRWILIFLILIASLLAAAYYYMPLMPSTLSAISVIDREQSSSETYALKEAESRQLISALQGFTENELPKDLIAAFNVTLHRKMGAPRCYEVYVALSREVYLKGAGSSRLIRSKDAHFFYNHEAFQNLYPFGQMPGVSITALDEEIFPRVVERRWQILKWDNNWHDGRMPVLPDYSVSPPVLTSTDNRLAFKVDPLPDSAFLQVTDPSGRTVFDGTLENEKLPIFERNGLYDYRLNLCWQDENQPYRGQYEACFEVIMDLPPVFELPERVVQGEMAAFYVYHLPEGVMPVLEVDTQGRLKFFPFEDGYVAYLPTNYATGPGEYRVVYGLEGEPLNESTLVVLPRDFHIQHLRVSAGIVASTRNEAAYEQFARYFPKARQTSADERYYSQPFVLPVPGRLTTEFGQTRYVNNAPTSYRHSGLDIAAPAGTNVLAANNGRVTLSMELILTGNTVVIDHGQGLFSVYYHMQELFVEEGQFIERGEPVGTVGSTGFSTGPHLHFTMSYFEHNLEPGYFLADEPITYENAHHLLRGR